MQRSHNQKAGQFEEAVACLQVLVRLGDAVGVADASCRRCMLRSRRNAHPTRWRRACSPARRATAGRGRAQRTTISRASPASRRLSDEPAGRVSRRAAAISADELSARIPSRSVSAKDGGIFRRPASAAGAMPPTDVSEACWRAAGRWSREGDPARGVPACSGCHGPKLTGMEPAHSRACGLRASYISAQLGAFRYGTRTAADAGLHAARRGQPDRRPT